MFLSISKKIGDLTFGITLVVTALIWNKVLLIVHRDPHWTHGRETWHLQVRASSYDSNKSTSKMQQFHKFNAWHLCVAQVSGASLPSSGAYTCTRSLWFYHLIVAVGALLVVVWQTTTNNAPEVTVFQGARSGPCRGWFKIYKHGTLMMCRKY
jgi:hypothetical protein